MKQIKIHSTKKQTIYYFVVFIIILCTSSPIYASWFDKLKEAISSEPTALNWLINYR